MKNSEQWCLIDDDINDCDCERLRDNFTALRTVSEDSDVYRCLCPSKYDIISNRLTFFNDFVSVLNSQ
jgi:hypothetical protein